MSAVHQQNETYDTYKHYTGLQQVPWEIQKYYHQRYDLFSKYDDGILMTDSAWYSVTPEPVANKIAQHVAAFASSRKAILIDCFAGVGGNTIAFARSTRWKRIYAIEQDENAICCGRHNAKLYGVDHKISWLHGDCFEIIENELSPLGQYSIIFASPPWGGPGYRTDAIFDLATMQPYSLKQLLDPFQQLTENIILFLPRTSDLRQVAKATNEPRRVKIIHYCMEGASKARYVSSSDSNMWSIPSKLEWAAWRLRGNLSAILPHYSKVAKPWKALPMAANETHMKHHASSVGSTTTDFLHPVSVMP